MLQETMKTVEEAEAKADGIIKKAKEDGADLIAEAKKKAEEILEQANATSKSDLKSAEAAQKENEEKLAEKALKDADTEIGSLKKKAVDKEKAVVSMVVNELI